MPNYKITLFTGDVDDAGTDAQVFITISGNPGMRTTEYILDKVGNDREQGSVDTYTVESRDIGRVSAILIRHDNTGDRPGWFLDKVTVVDQGSGDKFTFPYYNWLAVDENNGSLRAYLLPS